MVVLTAVDVEQAPEQPIEVGYDVAAAYDDELVVLHVVSDDEYERQRSQKEDLPSEFQGGYSLEQANGVASNRAREAVEAAVGEFDHERITTRGRVGDAADVIVAVAEELDPRFVVVGGRQRSLARQALFGSISQSVMRELERPVVTIMEPEE